jgi:hypothetical protein
MSELKLRPTKKEEGRKNGDESRSRRTEVLLPLTEVRGYHLENSGRAEPRPYNVRTKAPGKSGSSKCASGAKARWRGMALCRS